MAEDPFDQRDRLINPAHEVIRHRILTVAQEKLLLSECTRKRSGCLGLRSTDGKSNT